MFLKGKDLYVFTCHMSRTLRCITDEERAHFCVKNGPSFEKP